MGQDKSYIIISGLMLDDANRGTAALGYGAISFLHEKGYFSEKQELLELITVKRFWKYKDYSEKLNIQGYSITNNKVFINFVVMRIFMLTGVLFPNTKLRRYLKRTRLVAAINGGDGFSDIYNTQTFIGRLRETFIAYKAKIPVIFLPQTLGPFERLENYQLAISILKLASKIYIRDNKFVPELNKMGIGYELTKDLSAFMQPECCDINIMNDSIGINISGLCYSNSFRTLSGQFEYYPELIDRIIKHFQKLGKTIYLIPHSYRYGNPEKDNDDIVACRVAFNKLEDKTNIFFIDSNLTSPQVKYVISKMSFFIGTRMHANFAAIYTNVPLFGLAYSYKFAGAFNANGLNGENQTAMINNIKIEDIDNILSKISKVYNELKQ